MQFQDGGRGDSVLLQVSYLMWLHSSEVQNLQTQFHRYISINVRDITISGVEKPDLRHIGFFLPVATSTTSQ